VLPGEDHLLLVDVDVGGLVEEHRDVLLALENAAQRLGDIRRRELGRRHLVEQRREEVMVPAIDERDIDVGVLQPLDDVETGEAAADDDDARPAVHLDRGLDRVGDGDELLDRDAVGDRRAIARCARRGRFLRFRSNHPVFRLYNTRTRSVKLRRCGCPCWRQTSLHRLRRACRNDA